MVNINLAIGLYFMGLGCGVFIGMEYYRHQITVKKNPKVIARVQDWLRQAR